MRRCYRKILNSFSLNLRSEKILGLALFLILVIGPLIYALSCSKASSSKSNTANTGDFTSGSNNSSSDIIAKLTKEMLLSDSAAAAAAAAASAHNG